MKTGILALIAVVCSVVGFGCGWAVSQAQNADKLSPAAAWANGWVADVGFLTGAGRNAEPVAPDKVAQLVGLDLNVKSIVLARLYDGMPQPLKTRLLSYAPAARVIGALQNGVGTENNRQDLLSFVSCMETVKVKGGLVRSCVKGNSK